MTYPPPPAGEDEEEKPGDSYTGRIEHGKREGSGKYTWSNGAAYDGEYVANKKQGHGVMVYPDKSKFDGRQSCNVTAKPCDAQQHPAPVDSARSDMYAKQTLFLSAVITASTLGVLAVNAVQCHSVLMVLHQ